MAFSANENVVSEYETNTVLAELDRVLRSTSLVERCDGILKLPQYFERLPFQMFINSAFLKLMEAFRNGSYLTRKWILHVAENSDKHLHKISSRDELMSRIFPVTHSNDPSARALTLRLFASFARILADRKQLHYLICTGLDSNDKDELHASIFAAQRFAKHSPEFGRCIYDKAMEMLMSIYVPPETKLLLAPIFEQFCSDPETSQKAVIFCRDQFLPQTHSSVIIGRVLIALTKLAVDAPIIASIQLELLLTYVESRKVSKRVSLAALDCLHYMVKRKPQIWNAEAVKVLANFCDRVENSDDLAHLRALQIFSTLTSDSVVQNWSSELVTRVIDLCCRRCYSTSHLILSVACVIATNLMRNLDESVVREQLFDRLVMAMTAAVATWPWRIESEDLLNAAKDLLRCVLRISKFDPMVAQTFAYCLIGVVQGCSGNTRQLVSECIFALCDADIAVADTLQRYDSTALIDSHLATNLLLVPKLSVSLLIGQTFSMDQLISQCGDTWELFCLGRRAFRYGYATVAKNIFCILQNANLAEQSNNWIKALALIATAEECLVVGDEQSSINRLAMADYNYQLALIYMKAAVTASNSFWFPLAFIRLRTRFLSAVRELHVVWNVAVLVPAPTSSALDPSDPKSKMSRLINQLSYCETLFGDICNDYASLICRCFDADTGTIELLKLLKIQSSMVQQAIRSVIGNKDKLEFNMPETVHNAQTRILTTHVEWFANEIIQLRSNLTTLTEQAIDTMLAMVDRFCFDTPFFMPRFFFQSLQTTAIKLSVSAKPAPRDLLFRLSNDQQFLLSVEGVATITGPKGKSFRKIESAVVTVSVRYTTNHVPANGKTNTGSVEEGKTLEQTVSLSDDYFLANFTLDLALSGTIDVHVDVIDSRGTIWDANAEEHVKVKVLPSAA